jgi:thioredoxin-like negative regulator of GroEL
VTVDIDEHPHLAESLKVSAVPNVKVCVDGQVKDGMYIPYYFKGFVGLPSNDSIKAFFSGLIKK